MHLDIFYNDDWYKNVCQNNFFVEHMNSDQIKLLTWSASIPHSPLPPNTPRPHYLFSPQSFLPNSVRFQLIPFLPGPAQDLRCLRGGGGGLGLGRTSAAGIGQHPVWSQQSCGVAQAGTEDSFREEGWPCPRLWSHQPPKPRLQNPQLQGKLCQDPNIRGVIPNIRLKK